MHVIYDVSHNIAKFEEHISNLYILPPLGFRPYIMVHVFHFVSQHIVAQSSVCDKCRLACIMYLCNVVCTYALDSVSHAWGQAEESSGTQKRFHACLSSPPSTYPCRLPTHRTARTHWWHHGDMQVYTICVFFYRVICFVGCLLFSV